MVDLEDEFRRQFREVFGKADFPLSSPFKLIPLLEGPFHYFEAGGVEIPAIDLGMVYGDYQDWPYEDVDSLVDDLISGLKEEGTI